MKGGKYIYFLYTYYIYVNYYYQRYFNTFGYTTIKCINNKLYGIKRNRNKKKRKAK